MQPRTDCNDHVVCQYNGLPYYLPLFFQYSESFRLIVPCFLRDVIQHYQQTNGAVVKKYYEGSLANANVSWFYNNHPIAGIFVMGCVVGCKWRWIGDVDFAILALDDCTKAAGQTSFLSCKCSRNLILGCGLPTGNLSGWKLRLRGTMSINRLELDVEDIEIVEDLIDEIKFWKAALEYRTNLEVPWVIQDSVLLDYFTQEDKRDSSASKTNNFIELLQREQFQREMEITSPYSFHHGFYSQNLWNSRSAEDLLVEGVENEFDVEDTHLMIPIHERKSATNDQRDNHINITDTCNEFDIPKPQTSVLHSFNSYKQQLLKYLLTCGQNSLSIWALYQDIGLTKILEVVATRRFHQQFTKELQPIDKIKMSLFQKVIQQYIDMGLLQQATGDEVTTKSLIQCFSFIVKRTQTFIKLECDTGKIDYDNVRQSVGLPRLKNKIILDLFKESLRQFTDKPTSVLKQWWIDAGNDTGTFIHFDYR